MKKLKLKEEDIEKAIESGEEIIRDSLNKSLIDKLTIDFSDFTKLSKEEEEEKATLLFTARAWIKITQLVHAISEEVAWNMFVKKINETTYLITDIIVFEQIITATSVDTDEEKYAVWNAEFMQQDFETWSEMKGHGHSHVNMGVTPSTTDNGYREQIFPNIAEDSFYIYTIHNKKGEIHCLIVDKENNRLYENGDIIIDILLSKDKLTGNFINESKEKLSKPATIISSTSTSKYYNNYNAQERKYATEPTTTTTTNKSTKEDKRLKKTKRHRKQGKRNRT